MYHKPYFTIAICAVFICLSLIMFMRAFITKHPPSKTLNILLNSSFFILVIALVIDISLVSSKPPHTDYNIEIYKDSVSIYSSDTLVKKVPFENLEETLINDNL